jgi:spermidine/putrescine transport system permease protein
VIAWVRERLVVLAAALALLFLFAPVIVVFVFSFNDPAGRFNFAWQRFSLAAWREPCAAAGMCDSLIVSIQVGLLATLVATALGTLLAFGLVRHRFRGRSATNLLIFLPMATPEVVMGASLLALFVQGGVERGFWTIFFAHVLFCLSFVVVTVKARLQGMDPSLEQAAMDLYANEWQTFRLVTLPLVLPGILAAALLSFSLSFDDFIITNFNSGSVSTFPKYIYISASRGIPAEANVIASAVFIIALVIVITAQVSRAARVRRLAKLG